MKLNANKSKLLINSFANGDLDRVMQFHRQFGNEIFEFSHTTKNRGRTSRAISYSLKNGHFNIIDFYLKSMSSVFKFTNSEIRSATMRLVHSDEYFNSWIDGYNLLDNRDVVIDSNYLFSSIIGQLVNRNKYYLIDSYIERYPESLHDFITLCGNNAKGIQLKRELLLRQIL